MQSFGHAWQFHSLDLVLDCPSVLCHTNSQRPPGLSNVQYVAEHSAQRIEYTTPFTSIIPSLPFAFMRDFLRVSLEVKTVCTPSGLHALLIFVCPRSGSHVTGSATSGGPTPIYGRHPFVALQLADDDPQG